MKVYLIREGKLRRALRLAYENSNPLGKYDVLLKHPNMEIRLHTDDLSWIDEVADFVSEVIVFGD